MHFVMPLVKAVQEQQEMINKQQAEIEALKATNAGLAGIQIEFDQLRAEVNKIELNQSVMKK
ncbi:hypothetical protein BH10BAC3_BH10BAC3_39160 [soil metagenome]